jgi:EmrB/QacA subfamily drug resistance transporter
MGKVPAFIIGVVGFAAASMVCALATGETQMLVGRVLQGISACLMQPASSALVVSSFSEGERGKAMAVYVGIPLLFMALGPALGGVVVQYASWRWVFYLNLPVAALAIALTLMARARDARSPDRSIDWLGGALLLTGLPLFVLGLQEMGARTGSLDWWILAALATGVVLLAVFARRQWRIPNPLLRLRLFSNRSLRGSALVIGCMQFAMTGFVIQGSIYAQEVLGFTPLQAGASLLPLLVPVILVVHVAGRWYDRVGARSPAVWGTALATVGQLVQALGAFQQNYTIMAAGMAIMGTGIALTISPANTDALSRVAAHERGQVSGLVQTMRQVGGTMGVAITAAAVIFAQTQMERASGQVTHQQLQDLRDQFKSKDHDTRQRALDDPRASEARAILSSSMAAGGVVASFSTAAAFVLAVRLLERKPQRPKSPR